MTEQEITQARDNLEQLGIEQLRCGVMLQLLKIEALTKERDESRRQSDLQMNSAIKFCQERNAARIERDALAAAAKLAAAALEKVHYEAINSGVNNYSRLLGGIAKAHDALKAGVQ